MNRTALITLLAVVLAALVAVPTGAAELTVNSILTAQQAGAPADGILAMVNDPANNVTMTVADITSLRDAGVSERVITAIWNRLPAPASAQLRPDDVRLINVVRLITSGMSDTNTAEQVRQSGKTYNLTVNDLLYLKQNGVQDSTIAALMATSAATPDAPAIAPSELIFNGLVLANRGFWRKDSDGRLVMRGDTLTWENARHPEKNFTFQTAGLEKVWFTCEARSSSEFCHQINFKVVKGDRYKFQDSGRDTGSNTAVVEVMDALRTYHPRLNFAKPNVDD